MRTYSETEKLKEGWKQLIEEDPDWRVKYFYSMTHRSEIMRTKERTSNSKTHVGDVLRALANKMNRHLLAYVGFSNGYPKNHYHILLSVLKAEEEELNNKSKAQIIRDEAEEYIIKSSWKAGITDFRRYLCSDKTNAPAYCLFYEEKEQEFEALLSGIYCPWKSTSRTCNKRICDIKKPQASSN